MGIAIALGIIIVIANIDWHVGQTNIARPIVLGTLVGIVMGDIPAGVMMGATLELAFIGAVAIGAAIPPETMVGTVLAVAFAIGGGHGVETALLLAVPISALALFGRLLNLAVISTLCLHRADRYAAEGNINGVVGMHLAGGYIKTFSMGILTMAAYLAGSAAVETVINSIPQFVHTGLSIATGLMPAIGLAMLAKLLMSKEVAAFFFMGFLVVAYLGVNVTGMALMGIALSVIIVSITRKRNQVTANTDGGGSNDDDF